jgi:hypothetical protein
VNTLAKVQAGRLLVVLRSDGGVYIGEPDAYGVMSAHGTIRIGSTSAICEELAAALKTVAAIKRIQ